MGKKLRCWALGVAVVLSLAGSAVTLAVTPAGLQSRQEDVWVLGEYGGCVAVFKPGDGLLPSHVTDVSVCLLPAADREQLVHGIRVNSRRELLMLLEDFSS